MRSVVIVYCFLTLIFAGGWCFLLLATGAGVSFSFPQVILTFAAVANGAFLWMIMKRGAPEDADARWHHLFGRTMPVAWRGGIWGYLGPQALVVLALFLWKVGRVCFAGKECRGAGRNEA